MRKRDIIIVIIAVLSFFGFAAYALTAKEDHRLAERQISVAERVFAAAPKAMLAVQQEPVDVSFVQGHEEAEIPSFESQAEEVFAEEIEAATGSEIEAASTYLGTFTVTAYCNCPECCGSYSGGPTASGAYPSEGWTCACNSFSLGTIVEISGIGTRCIEDRGDSIMDDMWIDLYFEDHDEAQSFGMQFLDVYMEVDE